jgi:hypothetical protein
MVFEKDERRPFVLVKTDAEATIFDTGPCAWAQYDYMREERP